MRGENDILTEQNATIRRAEARDLPALGALLEQVEMVHHLGRPDLFKNGGRKYHDGQLLEMLPDERRPIFVYDDEQDGVLGYAFCLLEDHAGDNVMTPIRTLYVDDICVFDHARGRGIGRAIYEYVREYARQIGCHNLTLNVWECNPGARAFYERMGMRPYKTGMEDILT